MSQGEPWQGSGILLKWARMAGIWFIKGDFGHAVV